METQSQDSVEERPQSVEEAWEIDRSALVIEKNLEKDLFSGKYKDMEVSIKFLKYSEICKLKKFAETRELSHRNLIQIIGICTKPMNHLVIFEPVSGSLHKAIHIDHIRFNPLTQVKMALDVANAMNYVHENGIILGDLKPSNLFLNRHADIKVFGHGLLGGQKLNYACSMHHDVVSYGEALWEILTKEIPLNYVVEEKARILRDDTPTTYESPMEEVFHILKKKIAKEAEPKVAQIVRLCLDEDTPSFGEIINHLKPSSKGPKTDRKSSQYFHYRDPELLPEQHNEEVAALASFAYNSQDFTDFGCGCGTLSAAAALLDASCVIGFDIDPHSLETATLNAEELEVQIEFVSFQCDITKLELNGCRYCCKESSLWYTKERSLHGVSLCGNEAPI